MKYEGNSVSDLNIAYIGGGSRGWALQLMRDLAIETQLSGTVKLYDIDFKAAVSNEIIGNKLTSKENTKGKWKYKAVEDISQALIDADFVIISILPGTFKEMQSDVHLPEEYGIYQSVGDTVGPGGLMRALRTIPMFISIAESIKKYCPKAWVINYTNPMTLCTRTLYKIFPEIKAFGCCHEVFGTQKLLACMIKDMTGTMAVERNEIKVNVLGINHFTWIDRASYKGTDLIPMYKEFVDYNYEKGYMSDKKSDEWVNKYFDSYNRVKFDLFKRYGLIAAAGDRHLAEFCPQWYLKSPEVAWEWKFGLTPVSWRIEDLNERLSRSERLAWGEEEIDLVATGEEGVNQMKALLGLGDLITNVNMPNLGQAIGIPKGAVVETNAVFGRDNIKPILAGGLPEDVNNLVMRHVYNQETTLAAAITKDKELAFRAFANDPMVNLSIKAARELFDRMFKNTSEYLKAWGEEL